MSAVMTIARDGHWRRNLFTSSVRSTILWTHADYAMNFIKMHVCELLVGLDKPNLDEIIPVL